MIHYQLYLSINLAIICTWWCKGVLLSAWLWVPGVLRDHYFPISDPAHEPRAEGVPGPGPGPIMCHWPVCRNIPRPLILTSPLPLFRATHWHQGSGLYHRVMFRAPSSVLVTGDLWLVCRVMQSLCVPWRACTAHQQPSCRAWETLPLSVAFSTSLLFHIRLTWIIWGNNPSNKMDHR